VADLLMTDGMVTAVRVKVPPEHRMSRFRVDVQGLRAVAVMLVLLYHAGVPWAPGGYIGVDVFFVISGFLITGLIVREVNSTGRMRLARFYARRARRLLPATALVLVFVALMTIVVLPATRWQSIAGDLAAASLYVVNWTMAARSVDYLQQGAAASPVQHFWSLAVEEQFYVVWPVLIVILLVMLRRFGRKVRAAGLLSGILLITVPSFVWSVLMTASDPARAYFVTTTRLWELGIGAVIAVGAAALVRIPDRVRAVIGWAGLAVIVYAAGWFTDATPFPGWAALAPTLGSAAILVAGLGKSNGLAPLRWPIMQDIGALSYSL
jgi:peptidoglycan/LPS O-acetylase OafA/YrhL